jgi:hypothetical protein
VQIMPRDIEIMRWIQEQKFMTGKQIRRMFWPGISENSREDYRRLAQLQKASCLKRSKKNIYRDTPYLVRSMGMKQLKAHGHYHGWNELYDVDYSMFRHDIDWISERVLMGRKERRNLADGMIFCGGNYFAIEYESSQKGKNRYKQIFLNYALDQEVKAVIYVLDSIAMAAGVRREAAQYKKIHFTTFQELQDLQLDAMLKEDGGSSSLKGLLEGKN